jgi:hypothetical protein
MEVPMTLLMTTIMVLAMGFTVFWFFAYASLLRENARYAAEQAYQPTDRMEAAVIRAARLVFRLAFPVCVSACWSLRYSRRSR